MQKKLFNIHPKFCVSLQVKVGKEVFGVQSFTKEFQSSSFCPGWQARRVQTEVHVQCVKEDCAHLGRQEIFWDTNLRLPQTQSSSHTSREYWGRQLLRGKTKVPQRSSRQPSQEPKNCKQCNHYN